MMRAVANSANVVVRAVRTGHRQQVWLSVAGLVLILVVATAYLLIGALRVKPFASSYRVTVQLPESGGLLPNQDVALRGVRIGRVESLQITDNGVNAVASITSKVRDPGEQRRARVGPVAGRRAVHQLRSRIRRRAVSARRQPDRPGPHDRPGQPGAVAR